jgi:anti-anti-sigma factor
MESVVAALNEFQLSIEEGDAVVRLRLVGEFDLAAAENFQEALKRAQSGNPALIIIDLGGLTFIDSTGLQMILKANARSRENGFRLEIVRGSEKVQRIFEVTGIHEHLPMVDHPSQASGLA